MKHLSLLMVMTTACLMYSGKPCLAADKIKIVTTTTVLANIAEQITGDAADIFYVASPKRDLHKVSPTPQDVLKTKKADIFIYHGLQAEPWLLPLLNASGRNEFLEANGKAIDASVGVEPLEVPSDVSRLEGDIHPFGNPHYWLDPANAKIAAKNITEGLKRNYPDDGVQFDDRLNLFNQKLEDKLIEWSSRMNPFKGATIVTYHRSWSYFVKAYGLEVVGEVEPKPGIPVTSKHLGELETKMRSEKVSLIITESYQDDKPTHRLAKATGAKVVELSQFNGGKKGANNYFDLMDYNIEQIEAALKGVRHG